MRTPVVTLTLTLVLAAVAGAAAAQSQPAPDEPAQTGQTDANQEGIVAQPLHTTPSLVWSVDPQDLRDEYPIVAQAVENAETFVPIDHDSDELQRFQQEMRQHGAEALYIEGTPYAIVQTTAGEIPETTATTIPQRLGSPNETSAAEESGDPAEAIPGMGEGLSVVLPIFVAIALGVFIIGALIYGQKHRR